ncbi:hypothetical protein [Cellulosilyticum ruminicola]|uniref:hypothetical protein n=1 Tax=Cellulosilyticum ruminicola TaxID=425254 RepID=UPI0006D2ABA0|nr:hypothetical protein [Cellulosilyticum ruminicola]
MKVRTFVSKLMICSVLVGSCTGVMGQEITLKQTTKTGATSNIQIKDMTFESNGVSYLAIKDVMAQIGTVYKWEAAKKGSQNKGILTIEAPNYFNEFYYNVLSNICDTYDEEMESGLTPLPKSLKGLTSINLETFNNYHTKYIQKKPIEVTINSQGYQFGCIMYDYHIINNTLMLPEGFMIQYLDVNPQTKKALPQNEAAKILKQKTVQLEQKLKLENPEEVLALWNRAQQTRNGALQYNLLSKEAKERVLPEVKTRGWVTGGSSPSLKGGKITVQKAEDLLNGEMRYTVTYESMLQGKVYETLEQVITIKSYKEENKTYYAITNVTGAVDYYTYESISEGKVEAK